MNDALFTCLGVMAMVFAALAIYGFVSAKPPLEPFATDDEVRFVFFHSPNCVWCKKARPQWDKFCADLDKYPMSYGGTRVQLVEVDGSKNPEITHAQNIVGFPTFKVFTPVDSFEMRTPPSPDAFRAFLVKSLGPEEPIHLTS